MKPRQNHLKTDRRATESEEKSERGRSARRPEEIPAAGWRDILLRTKRNIAEDNLSIVAAGVAFYVFLGLVPLLGAAISIYGLVANPADIQEQVRAMSGFLPPDVITILEEQISRIASNSKAAGWGAALGLVIALWSGAKGTKAMINALNIAYQEEETRGFFRLTLISLGLTLAGILAVLLAVGLVAIMPVMLQYVGLGSVAKTTVSVLRWPLLVGLALIGIAVLYRYAPDRSRPQWRWLTWGSGLAAVMWLVASGLFSFYVSSFGNYNKTYGSLAAVVILMLWFMISAYAVLLGAELNGEMEHQTAEDSTENPSKPRGKRGAFVADDVGEKPE